jgi:hypothetical protein
MLFFQDVTTGFRIHVEPAGEGARQTGMTHRLAVVVKGAVLVDADGGLAGERERRWLRLAHVPVLASADGDASACSNRAQSSSWRARASARPISMSRLANSPSKSR